MEEEELDLHLHVEDKIHSLFSIRKVSTWSDVFLIDLRHCIAPHSCPLNNLIVESVIPTPY